MFKPETFCSKYIHKDHVEGWKLSGEVCQSGPAPVQIFERPSWYPEEMRQVDNHSGAGRRAKQNEPNLRE
jgi:hypothetical protein